MNLRRRLSSHALHIVSTQYTHNLIDRPIPVHTSLGLFIVNDFSLVHSFSQSQSRFIAGYDFTTLSLFLSHTKPPPLNIMTRQLSKVFLWTTILPNQKNTIEQRITLSLHSTFDQLAPLRSVTIWCKRNSWVTSEILKAMKERNHAYKKASQSHCPQEKEEHNGLRALVLNFLDTAKNRYLESRRTKAKYSKERW